MSRLEVFPGKYSQFTSERGNLYATDEVVKLSNFVSGEFVDEKATNPFQLLLRMGKNDTGTPAKSVFATIMEVNLTKLKFLPQQLKNREG